MSNEAAKVMDKQKLLQNELKRIERKINNRLQMIEDAKNSVFDTVYLKMKKACRMV